MLDKLLKKLSGNAQAKEEVKSAFTSSQIAFAALLVEAARIDQEYTADEKKIISALIEKKFSLSGPETTELILAAEAAQDRANDIYRFSSVIKSEFSEEEKIELVEGLWEIILSDETTDQYEEMIMRRLMGLIYVSDQDNAKARQRVIARKRDHS